MNGFGAFLDIDIEFGFNAGGSIRSGGEVAAHGRRIQRNVLILSGSRSGGKDSSGKCSQKIFIHDDKSLNVNVSDYFWATVSG